MRMIVNCDITDLRPALLRAARAPKGGLSRGYPGGDSGNFPVQWRAIAARCRTIRPRVPACDRAGVPGSNAARATDHPRMQPDGHHAGPAFPALPIEPIEGIAVVAKELLAVAKSPPRCSRLSLLSKLYGTTR